MNTDFNGFVAKHYSIFYADGLPFAKVDGSKGSSIGYDPRNAAKRALQDYLDRTAPAASPHSLTVVSVYEDGSCRLDTFKVESVPATLRVVD